MDREKFQQSLLPPPPPYVPQHGYDLTFGKNLTQKRVKTMGEPLSLLKRIGDTINNHDVKNFEETSKKLCSWCDNEGYKTIIEKDLYKKDDNSSQDIEMKESASDVWKNCFSNGNLLCKDPDDPYTYRVFYGDNNPFFKRTKVSFYPKLKINIQWVHRDRNRRKNRKRINYNI